MLESAPRVKQTVAGEDGLEPCDQGMARLRPRGRLRHLGHTFQRRRTGARAWRSLLAQSRALGHLTERVPPAHSRSLRAGREISWNADEHFGTSSSPVGPINASDQATAGGKGVNDTSDAIRAFACIRLLLAFIFLCLAWHQHLVQLLAWRRLLQVRLRFRHH